MNKEQRIKEIEEGLKRQVNSFYKETKNGTLYTPKFNEFSEMANLINRSLRVFEAQQEEIKKLKELNDNYSKQLDKAHKSLGYIKI